MKDPSNKNPKNKKSPPVSFTDMGNLLLKTIPHARYLGMELLSVQKGAAEAKVSYREDLVGDTETGVVHGGVITSLLDNLSGVAVASALGNLFSLATLDLRIDYMRAAQKEKDILAHAHCYKVTKNIAFVRASAYEVSIDDPIATSVASFMIETDIDTATGKEFHAERGD